MYDALIVDEYACINTKKLMKRDIILNFCLQPQPQPQPILTKINEQFEVAFHFHMVDIV